jgi:copper(I)-binding protein
VLHVLCCVIGLFLATTVYASGESTLELENAWVRVLPPTQSNTAAYVTVRNTGPAAVRITGASAGLAGRVELHDSVAVEGMQRMQQQPFVDVPPGAQVEFAPGGLHLMLLGLERMPAAGEAIQLCLQLGSETLCTEARARKSAGPTAHHHH